MSAATFEDESARLRALMASGARVYITSHAFDEMAADGVARLDVEDMLCDCIVTRIADSQCEQSWRAEGQDFEGRRITAIVVPHETANPPYLTVVTVWVKK